jgi:DNA replication protein DnaC
MEARDERRLRSLQKHLASVKLLILDELGYVPFTAVGGELLFEVLSQRYERGSTLITSNLPFDEWTSVFGRALDWRPARPPDPPRAHPRDEW